MYTALIWTSRFAQDPSAYLPTVTAHGMGDSCFNEGSMQYITNRVADLTHQYATCIPTGDNHYDVISNGYFMSMNEHIDIFAQKVKTKFDYQKYSQLVELGNEGHDHNRVLNDNFAKTQKFVLMNGFESIFLRLNKFTEKRKECLFVYV